MRSVMSSALRGSLAAIQMPASTATTPTARLSPMGSPMMIAARIDALTGCIAMVLATRVGDARLSAKIQSQSAMGVATSAA